MNKEDKYYKIFFEGPEAMLICHLDDKRIVDANKSYLKILGIESDVIDIKELNYTQTWLFTRDRDIFFKRIRVEGSMNDYQVPFEKRDGSIIYTSLSGSIITEDNIKLVVIVVRDITETKRIEMKLVENEHFTESITHLTPDFLYISDLAMKKRIYSNKSILEYLGYDRSEFILDETKFLHNIINKDDININRELINKKHNDLKNGEKLEYSYRAKAKNGQDLWFLNTEVVFKYNAYNEPIQILGVVREITKQKEIEQRISYMLEFTTKIVESSTVGIVTFSENGDCIQANDAAINILGTTREFVLENNFNKIEAWKASGILERAKKALKENITEELSVNTITSFGKNIWLDIRLVPFLAQNEKNLLVLFNDITDKGL